ncbi:MAG: hypothetical protein AAF456_10095, partial [Planctomycetota bacterium]
SRWVVYFQGALLGVVATVFFLFGMIVGHFTAGSQSASERLETTVSGRITFERGAIRLPDQDAVVMLLPANQRPDERSKALSIHPDSFEPLDNVGIDRVHELGGAIVRADEQGRFRVVVDGPQKFNVLVVSKNALREDDEGLTRDQMAAVANYFFPVEDAVSEKLIYWTTIHADRDSIDLADIEF